MKHNNLLIALTLCIGLSTNISFSSEASTGWRWGWQRRIKIKDYKNFTTDPIERDACDKLIESSYGQFHF